MKANNMPTFLYILPYSALISTLTLLLTCVCCSQPSCLDEAPLTRSYSRSPFYHCFPSVYSLKKC